MDTGVGCGVVDEAAIAGQPFLSTMLYDGKHSIDGIVDLAGRAGPCCEWVRVLCVSVNGVSWALILFDFSCFYYWKQ